jgi:hypothetical protein
MFNGLKSLEAQFNYHRSKLAELEHQLKIYKGHNNEQTNI